MDAKSPRKRHKWLPWIIAIGFTLILPVAYVKFTPPTAAQINQFKAMMDLKAIVQASQFFFEDYDRWPVDLSELTQSRTPTGVRYIEREPTDPWFGLPYPFIREGKKLSVASWGADGAPGGVGFDADLFEEIRVANE